MRWDHGFPRDWMGAEGVHCIVPPFTPLGFSLVVINSQVDGYRAWDNDEAKVVVRDTTEGPRSIRTRAPTRSSSGSAIHTPS